MKKTQSKRVLTFPENPGCYLFRNFEGKVIYVGKAKNLNKRISSYLVNKERPEKEKRLLENYRKIDFFITDSETEALILENNLIKKYMPKYNILLKDSKRYAYIEMTKEEFPRLLIARDRNLKNKIFGPFVSGNIRDLVLQTLQRSFQIRTCKKLPKKACLRFQLNLCSAPCVNQISKENYNQRVDSVEMVLSGHVKELIKKLKEKMKGSSINHKFEEALVYRDQINALEWLNEKQNVERKKKFNEDIINYIIKKDKVYLILFNVHNGILDNKEEFIFDNEEDFLETFIMQYYSENSIPKELILPKKITTTLHNYLEKIKGSKLKITIPLIGQKKDLLKLIKKNIEKTFFKNEVHLNDLKEKLKLEFIPKVIECFDVSHLSGTANVASMVSFNHGVPDKSNYRRFKLRTDKNDDYSGIKEAVSRRYSRLLKENKDFPDLIIIDGGKGQLTVAVRELIKLGLKIPTISIAKREEEIYVPGRMLPLKIAKTSKASILVQQIRDEAHRFAIKYNKLLRKKIMKNEI
jgi:excinuclease ABC subunit C